MKLHLFAKMLLLILLPAVLGLCIVTGFSYYEAKNSLVSQIDSGLDTIAASEASQLENLIRVLYEGMHTATNFTEFKEFILADTPEERARLEHAMQVKLDGLINDFPLIKSGGILDSKGIVIGDTNPSGRGRDFGDRSYFTDGMRGKSGYVNSYNKIDGSPATILGYPITDNGKPIGVLFALLNIELVSAETIGQIHPGSSGACMIYDTTGLLLSEPNKSSIGNKDQKPEWLLNILRQRNGRAQYEWKDIETIAYFHYVPSMDWVVIVTMDRSEALAPATSLLFKNLLLSSIIILIVGFIVFYVSKNISWTLRGLSSIVGQIADGNFNITPNQKKALMECGKRNDEIGILTRGVDVMLNNLKKLFAESEEKTREALDATDEAQKFAQQARDAQAIENARREKLQAIAVQMEGVAVSLTEAAQQLIHKIQDSNSRASESAEHLDASATAMNEMNATVKEVANNAGAASNVSVNTKEKAVAGAQIVDHSINVIEQVHQSSLELKEDMNQLQSKVHDISQIMGVISDIADQTNLLALNAAIEAARAGDAGRGFAVVADEVRKLAEKTMESTNDVRNVVINIQESTAKSMRGMDNSVNLIADATEQARQSGEALRQIVETVENTVDQVNAIATASEEQSATSEEINRSITKINEMSQQTAEAMSEAAENVAAVTAEINRLNELINQMKMA